MEMNFESYNQLRSKRLGNQPLSKKEHAALKEFETKFKDVLNPGLSLSDIIAALKYERKTASFEEFHGNILENIALEQEINRFHELRARRPRRTKSPKRTLKLFELTSSLVSLIITAWLALKLHDYKLQFPLSTQEALNTNTRESIKHQLPDGTFIILNAGSSISYPGKASNNNRMISLSGEAYFEVSPVPRKPFIVSAQHQQLKAVAAASFNICTYPDGTTKTTVVGGAVFVCLDTIQKIVKTGEQAIVTDHKIIINKYPAANELVAWKDNRFFFTLQPVSDIMISLERWYGVNIQFKTNDSITTVRHTLDETKDLPVSKVLGRLEKNKVLTFYPKKTDYYKGDTIWITQYNFRLNGQTAHH